MLTSKLVVQRLIAIRESIEKGENGGLKWCNKVDPNGDGKIWKKQRLAQKEAA